jgi:predicted Zn-ribbon and HTH transcriptional regulator
METLENIISKLNSYSIEYKNEGNLKFFEATKGIINFIRQNKLKEAITLFRTSDLLYDIGNTYDALKKIDAENYVTENFDVNWGLKAGEYIAYRSGAIDNQKNGIFFSISKGGAEAYSDSSSNRETKAYKVKISNPLVARRAEHAYFLLTGKNVPKSLQQDGGKEDWWVQLDAKIVSLAKDRGYDSVTYTNPAPPALKELILFKNQQVIQTLNNGGKIINSFHNSENGLNVMNYKLSVKEHDKIAKCNSCNQNFSYENRKRNIKWECPNCKSKTYIK